MKWKIDINIEIEFLKGFFYSLMNFQKMTTELLKKSSKKDSKKGSKFENSL